MRDLEACLAAHAGELYQGFRVNWAFGNEFTARRWLTPTGCASAGPVRGSDSD